MIATSELSLINETQPHRPSRVVRLLLAMTSPTESKAAIRRAEFPFLPTPSPRTSRPLDLLDSQLIDRNLTS